MQTSAQRKHAVYMRKWRAANPEKVRVISRLAMRKWTAANREKVRATNLIASRKFRAANPELCRDRVQTSKQKKPHLARKNCADRKARKIQATPSWLTQEQHDVMEALYASAHVTKMHVDHIVPLRGEDVCGLHVHWNMQLLQPEANMAKGNSVNL